MNSNTELKNENKNTNQETLKVSIMKIRNNFILKKIFVNLKRIKQLDIIKYNKILQNRLNFSFNDYKEYRSIYSEIEIELVPVKNKFGNFINIINESEKDYFHIFFNDNPERFNIYRIKRNQQVDKIKIIIDYQVKSFSKLFNDCKCIESINFKKFYRNNITDMSYMFGSCEQIKEINFSKFNTDNVNHMNDMFFGCHSLQELDLSNFRTDNVIDMSSMFCGCTSLKKLNLSNFITNKVTDMGYMFNYCKKLEELNVSSFNTENVKDMTFMFRLCRSIKNLNISNFKTNNVKKMICIFDRCSSLEKLNIDNFSFNNVVNGYDMFIGCVSLKEIIINKNNEDIYIKIKKYKGRLKAKLIYRK